MSLNKTKLVRIVGLCGALAAAVAAYANGDVNTAVGLVAAALSAPTLQTN